MRAIKLCKGTGNGVDSACLATAAAMMNGEKPTDHPECMCPVIAAFVRPTNDSMPAHIRSELYGPLVMEVIGTRSTPKIERKRAFMCADFAVRVAVPHALRAINKRDLALNLENLSRVECKKSARAAARAARTASRIASRVVDAATRVATRTADYTTVARAADCVAVANAVRATADHAARAASHAVDAHAVDSTCADHATRVIASAHAADIADSAAYAATYAARANKAFDWTTCRDLIRDLIALDPPAPVEPAMSLDTLAGMLQ